MFPGNTGADPPCCPVEAAREPDDATGVGRDGRVHRKTLVQNTLEEGLTFRSDGFLPFLRVGYGEHLTVVVREDEMEALSTAVGDGAERERLVGVKPEQKLVCCPSSLFEPSITKRSVVDVKHHQVVDQDRMRPFYIASLGQIDGGQPR